MTFGLAKWWQQAWSVDQHKRNQILNIGNSAAGISRASRIAWLTNISALVISAASVAYEGFSLTSPGVILGKVYEAGQTLAQTAVNEPLLTVAGVGISYLGSRVVAKFTGKISQMQESVRKAVKAKLKLKPHTTPLATVAAKLRGCGAYFAAPPMP
jgi:hypothetical protein